MGSQESKSRNRRKKDMKARTSKVFRSFVSILLVMAFTPIPAVTAYASDTVTVSNAADLQAALTTGGNIKLGADIVVTDTDTGTDSLAVPNGVTAVLDLAGYTISGANKSGAILSSSGTLTIDDSSNPSTGTITNTANADTSFTTTAQGARQSALLNNGGTMTINAGTFTANTATYATGYAVCSAFDNVNGDATINGGTMNAKWGVRNYSNDVAKTTTLTLVDATINAVYNGGSTEIAAGSNVSTSMYNSGTLNIDGTLNANYIDNAGTMFLGDNGSITGTTTYTVTTSVSGTGTVSPSGKVAVVSGSTQTFTITPGDGQYLKSLTYGTSDVTTAGRTGTYTTSAYASSATLTATFANADEGYYVASVSHTDESGATNITGYYLSLQDAFTAAVAGDTVTIGQDIVLPSTITITKDVKLTSASNGSGYYTITPSAAIAADGYHLFKVAENANATFTLEDINLNGGGVKEVRAIRVLGGGNNLVINDGTTISGFASEATAQADLMSGIAVRVQGDSNFTMNGGMIFGNHTNYVSCAVVLDNNNGTFTMNGGSIVNNTGYTNVASDVGIQTAGVFTASTAKMVYNGGTISGNVLSDGNGNIVNSDVFINTNDAGVGMLTVNAPLSTSTKVVGDTNSANKSSIMIISENGSYGGLNSETYVWTAGNKDWEVANFVYETIVGDNTTYSYTLSDAVAAAGTSIATIVQLKDYSLPTDVVTAITIPGAVTLSIPDGLKLTVPAGDSLTIADGALLDLDGELNVQGTYDTAGTYDLEGNITGSGTVTVPTTSSNSFANIAGKATVTPYIRGYRIYAGGTPVTISKTEGAANDACVTIAYKDFDGNDASIAYTAADAVNDTSQVYGGIYHGDIAGATNITVKSGTFDSIFGGGQGSDEGNQALTGETHVTLDGTTSTEGSTTTDSINVQYSVYGGGNDGGNITATNVNVIGGASISGAVYGGGIYSGTVADANVIISGGSVNAAFAGGTEASSAVVDGSVQVHGGYVGRLYGGSEGSRISTSAVTIDGGEVGFLFAGGLQRDGQSTTGTVTVTAGAQQINYIYAGSEGTGTVADATLNLTGTKILAIQGGAEGGTIDNVKMTEGQTASVAKSVLNLTDCTVSNIVYAGGGSFYTDSTNAGTITTDVSTINILGTTKASYVSGGSAKATSAQTASVGTANINIGGQAVLTTVTGGGYGTVTKANIAVNGGTIDELALSGFADSVTKAATLDMEAGTVGKAYSLNRGTLGAADFDLLGGNITELSLGGATSAVTATGTFTPGAEVYAINDGATIGATYFGLNTDGAALLSTGGLDITATTGVTGTGANANVTIPAAQTLRLGYNTAGALSGKDGYSTLTLPDETSLLVHGTVVAFPGYDQVKTASTGAVLIYDDATYMSADTDLISSDGALQITGDTGHTKYLKLAQNEIYSSGTYLYVPADTTATIAKGNGAMTGVDAFLIGGSDYVKVDGTLNIGNGTDAVLAVNRGTILVGGVSGGKLNVAANATLSGYSADGTQDVLALVGFDKGASATINGTAANIATTGSFADDTYYTWLPSGAYGTEGSWIEPVFMLQVGDQTSGYNTLAEAVAAAGTNTATITQLKDYSLPTDAATAITIPANDKLIVPDSLKLTVPAGDSLTIAQGATLRVDGELNVQGTSSSAGTYDLEGTITGSGTVTVPTDSANSYANLLGKATATPYQRGNWWIYAGGTPITVTETEGAANDACLTISYKDFNGNDQTLEYTAANREDDTAVVYGGLYHGDLAAGTSVNIQSGYINGVVGGGQGSSAANQALTGNTSVILDGVETANADGTTNYSVEIQTSVFGGGNDGGNIAKTDVEIADGVAVAAGVFGGGWGSGTVADANVNVTGGSLTRVFAGGYKSSSVVTDGSVTVSGGYIGSLYGGSQDGTIANSAVMVNGGEVGFLFAGGLQSSNSNTSSTGTSTVTVGAQKVASVFAGCEGAGTVEDATVNLNGTSVTTDVYGGSEGGAVASTGMAQGQSASVTRSTLNLTDCAVTGNVFAGSGVVSTYLANGGALSTEACTINILGSTTTNYVCGGSGHVSSTQTASVGTANINVGGTSAIGAVLGGGYGTVDKANIEVDSGTIDEVALSGFVDSTTTAAGLDMVGGTVGKVYSLNRGTLGFADFELQGGQITEFSLGGATNATSATGTFAPGAEVYALNDGATIGATYFGLNTDGADLISTGGLDITATTGVAGTGANANVTIPATQTFKLFRNTAGAQTNPPTGESTLTIPAGRTIDVHGTLWAAKDTTQIKTASTGYANIYDDATLRIGTTKLGTTDLIGADAALQITGDTGHTKYVAVAQNTDNSEGTYINIPVGTTATIAKGNGAITGTDAFLIGGNDYVNVDGILNIGNGTDAVLAINRGIINVGGKSDGMLNVAANATLSGYSADGSRDAISTITFGKGASATINGIAANIPTTDTFAADTSYIWVPSGAYGTEGAWTEASIQNMTTGEFFADLTAAVAASSETDTLRVFGPATMSAVTTIPEDMTVNVVEGGSVDMTGGYVLTNKGDMTIKGSITVANTDQLCGNGSYDVYTSGLVYVKAGGTTMEYVGPEGAVRVTAAATAEDPFISITENEMEGFTNYIPAGVTETIASSNSMSGTFMGKFVIGHYDEVLVESSGNLVINSDVTFVNDGGILMYSGANLKVDGTLISYNKVTAGQTATRAGVVMVEEGSNITVNGIAPGLSSGVLADETIYCWTPTDKSVANFSGSWNEAVAGVVISNDEGMYFADLQSAIDAADDGGMVFLMKDITTTSDITINKNIKLREFGDRNLTMAGDSKLTIAEGATLYNTVSIAFDGSAKFINNGKISLGTSSGSISPAAYVVIVPDSLELNEGCITTKDALAAGANASWLAEGRTVTYQWQLKNSDGTFTDIDGETGSIYQIPTDLKVGTYEYDCVITMEGLKYATSAATVTVSAAAPAMTVTPSTLDFGSTPTIGDVPAKQVVELENTGNADLTITSNIADLTGYTITGLPSTLAAGEKVAIEIQPNKATTNGSHEATLTIKGVAGQNNSAADVSIAISFETSTTWTRLAGSSRYATMAAIIDEGEFAPGGTVIVASGANFPDALAATALAGIYGAPIVLTDPATLSAEASTELTKLDPQNIILVGGSGAVSTTVENSLASFAPVKRIAGSSRADTALQIYKSSSSWSKTAIITTGAGYADALSIAPYAYASKSPLFLASNGTLDDATMAVLTKDNFDNVIIVGGSSAVSDETASALATTFGDANVTRLSGGNRYETSTAIAEYAVSSGVLSYNNMAVATGQNFPDALSGAALCGKNASVLLLSTDSDAGYAAVDATIGKNADVIAQGYYFGGTGAVSEDLAGYIEAQF